MGEHHYVDKMYFWFERCYIVREKKKEIEAGKFEISHGSRLEIAPSLTFAN